MGEKEREREREKKSERTVNGTSEKKRDGKAPARNIETLGRSTRQNVPSYR